MSFSYYDSELGKIKIEVEDKYISWEKIHNPTNEIEFILNNIIMSVYERWRNNH